MKTRPKTMGETMAKTKTKQNPEDDASPGALSKDGVQYRVISACIALQHVSSSKVRKFLNKRGTSKQGGGSTPLLPQTIFRKRLPQHASVKSPGRSLASSRKLHWMSAKVPRF